VALPLRGADPSSGTAGRSGAASSWTCHRSRAWVGAGRGEVAGPRPSAALPWCRIPVAVTGRGAPAPPDEPRRGVRPLSGSAPYLASIDLAKEDATKARHLCQLRRWCVRTAGELLNWGRGESRGWIEEAELREEERSRRRGGGGGEEMTAGCDAPGF
jgi:hypothetical protein